MGKHFWPIYIAVASISCALVWRFAPVLGDRFAALGLANLLAPAATVLSATAASDGSFAVRLAGGGRFAAWCAARPASVRAGRKDVPFSWDPATGLLLADATAARLSVVL